MNAWPEIPLGEVLIERQETPSTDDLLTGEVPIIAKIRFNDGQIELREDGKTKTNMILIRPGDLVLSGINAAKGAIAVFDKGAIGPIAATIHYGAYFPKENRVDIRFLWWLLRSTVFREALKRHVPGGIKTELKAKRFLPIPVPLPPLEEQRRVVARIEALAAKVDEAVRLREEAVGETKSLWAAEAQRVFTVLGQNNAVCKIGDIISIRNELIRPTDGETGELSFIGLQHIEPHTGRRIGKDVLNAETLKGRKFIFSPGEIVYGYLRPYLNKVWIADQDGVCSVDQYVIQPDMQSIVTKYLANFMRSPVFLGKANELTHNLMLPRLRSGLLKSIEIPVPEIEEQHRIVKYLEAVQAKITALRALQSETGTALDQLLPSVLDRAFRGEL